MSIRRAMKRYAVRWSNANGRVWHHTHSFNCVGDAEDYATAHPPADATHFTVTNLAEEHDCFERPLNGAV